jgi:hypothetical protein
MNHHLLHQAEESEGDDVGLGSISLWPDCWWCCHISQEMYRNVGFCKKGLLMGYTVYPIKMNKDGNTII